MKKCRNNLMAVLLAVIMILCAIPFEVGASNINASYAESQLSLLDSSNYLSDENFTIPNGAYFIKNETLNRYLQPDDGNLNVNLSEMELWNFDGSNYQKWNITYLNNGYYKIISVHSGKALSVKSGGENQNSSRIIQETYNGYYRQQWKIELTIHGMWRISPRSGYSNNWCMSADDGIFFMNGWHVEQKQYTNNTYYRDEWIISQMPTSGSELKYEPDLWGYDIIVYEDYTIHDATNCYSYALNEQERILWEWTKEDGEMKWVPVGIQPGCSDSTYNGNWTPTASNVTSRVAIDASNWGFTFQPSSANEICSAGTYKVALVIAPGKDYHWYRQNKDGSWSHKLGKRGDIFLTDASGNIIYNPELADRDYGYVNYSQFVGYYKITPTNNMYSANSNINLVSTLNITSNDKMYSTSSDKMYSKFEFRGDGEPAISCEKIDLITTGMTLSEITDIIGLPDRCVSSGTLIFKYSFDDGQQLFIRYGSYSDGELISISITKEGE